MQSGYTCQAFHLGIGHFHYPSFIVPALDNFQTLVSRLLAILINANRHLTDLVGAGLPLAVCNT